jgi:4a-hydroxytetrahydrobiopterin dehydratase
MQGALGPDEIRRRLAALSEWQLDGARLRKQYRFESFGDAMAFANRVAALAEAADHHPDILIEYHTVTLTLTSHDAGGLTGRDFSLAAQIDG